MRRRIRRAQPLDQISPNEIPIGIRVRDCPDGRGFAGEWYCSDRLRWIDDREHLRFRGGTGSRKTATTQGIVKSLMRPYRREYARADGTTGSVVRKDAVVMLDHGGDLACFHALREECAAIDPATHNTAERLASIAVSVKTSTADVSCFVPPHHQGGLMWNEL